MSSKVGMLRSANDDLALEKILLRNLSARLVFSWRDFLYE